MTGVQHHQGNALLLILPGRGALLCWGGGDGGGAGSGIPVHRVSQGLRRRPQGDHGDASVVYVGLLRVQYLSVHGDCHTSPVRPGGGEGEQEQQAQGQQQRVEAFHQTSSFPNGGAPFLSIVPDRSPVAQEVISGRSYIDRTAECRPFRQKIPEDQLRLPGFPTGSLFLVGGEIRVPLRALAVAADHIGPLGVLRQEVV